MKTKVLVLGLFFGALITMPQWVRAANLSLNPTTGTVAVGGVLSVSIFLDTDGFPVNTLDVFLRFPPDKLQVISPSVGQSVIGVWTAQPYFNNSTGEIHFQGGIPNGINVGRGLVSTVTFRVRQTGSAIVRFDSQSRVLAHDGKGTDVLENSQSGVYQLTLPPSQGPIIASETHPDQTRWYSVATAILRWSPIADAQYSYILNSEPSEGPDNIPDGTKNGIVYRDLSDGTHYFHLKALLAGIWGGVSHLSLNIDTTPPAEFPIRVIPGKRTVSKTPVLEFQTTDQSSGVSHYEYAVIPLQLVPTINGEKKRLFVEAQSPVILNLANGAYDILIRVYDRAGNMLEENTRLRVMNPPMYIATSPWTWLVALIAFAALWNGMRHAKTWREAAQQLREGRQLPSYLSRPLEKLKKYQDRYKNSMLVLLVSLLFAANAAYAQTVEFAPPFVSNVSQNITNDQIFYIGGKTDAGNVPVIIYLQNLLTGETQSATVTSDRKGDWFYRHSGFLTSGDYFIWTQAKAGEVSSPPSPQIRMHVEQTAIQFGASRVSYEVFYLALAILFFVILLGMAGYIAFHVYHGRRHHRAFSKEMREAEDAVKRGFAAVRQSVARELEMLQKARAGKAATSEELMRERQLLKDLVWAERYINKEIRDIEDTEHAD